MTFPEEAGVRFSSLIVRVRLGGRASNKLHGMPVPANR